MADRIKLSGIVGGVSGLRSNRKREQELIGLNIAYYRKAKKYTQKDIADKLIVDESYISKVETGATGISIPVLFDFAEAIGIPAHKLIDIDDQL